MKLSHSMKTRFEARFFMVVWCYISGEATGEMVINVNGWLKYELAGMCGRKSGSKIQSHAREETRFVMVTRPPAARTLRPRVFNPFTPQEWSISTDFPCNLTRNIASSWIFIACLLRWKMIILPILSTSSLIHFSFKFGSMYLLLNGRAPFD